MSEIVKTLATHTGIDATSIEKVLGVILGLLKSQLPAETFAQIESKIPESMQLVNAAPESSDESSGSLLDVASKIAGKVFGAKAEGGIDLMDVIGKLGISTATLASIVTSLFKFLAANLSPETMGQIAKALPAIPGVDLTSDDPR